MYISYNKYQVIAKTVILFLIFLLIGLFAYFHPPLPAFQLTFPLLFLLILFIVLCYFIIIMFLQLLFFPKAIEINTTDKTLTVQYFLHPQNIISLTDILEYSTTRLDTKSTLYEGVLVLTKSGRKYLFSDMNLSDYKPVRLFLDNGHISFKGSETFRNTSYFISFFKYRNGTQEKV